MIPLVLTAATAIAAVLGYTTISAMGITAPEIYSLFLKCATLASMIFAALGMFGFRKFFRYAYFLIAFSIVMGVLLNAIQNA